MDLFSQSVSQYIKHNWYVDILLLLSSSASHRHFLAWPRLSNFMFSISFVVVVTHSNIKFSIPYLYYFILFVNISTFDSIQRLIYLSVWCPCYMVYFLYIHSKHTIPTIRYKFDGIQVFHSSIIIIDIFFTAWLELFRLKVNTNVAQPQFNAKQC